MSWKHYNTETKKIEVVRTLVGDMEQFGAIVMEEDTWNVILQVSEPCAMEQTVTHEHIR